MDIALHSFTIIGTVVAIVTLTLIAAAQWNVAVPLAEVYVTNRKYKRLENRTMRIQHHM